MKTTVPLAKVLPPIYRQTRQLVLLLEQAVMRFGHHHPPKPLIFRSFAMKTFKTTPLRRVPAGVLAAALCATLWASAPAQAAGPRFVPSAAGDEVTDTQTGLVWRRCAEGQAWTGSTCAGSAPSMTWDGALSHAQSQAASTGLAWRVPNVKELRSLVNLARTSPAIDTAAFPNTPSDWFWTSTPYAGDADSAWVVDFYGGYVLNGNRNYDYYGAVRLVRVGQ
jgi:hypothetical protein